MRLAFFSPFNPQRSGISDYNEELLPYLSEAADIDLFVDGFLPTSRALLERFSVTDYKRRPASLNKLGDFDAVLYHMGNDHRFHAGIFDAMRHHPGIVVFHDFALQDFFIGLARARKNWNIYLDEVGACHGLTARREAERAIIEGKEPAAVSRPTDYPLNCRLARSAEGIIVHSEWSRSRFARIAPGVPLTRIQMPVKAPGEIAGAAHPQGEASDQIKLASFGLIIPGKGIDLILRTLGALRNEYNFHYTLVGSENPYFDVRALIKTYGLTDRVTITGHVSLEEFEQHIAATDIAINLRERTVGETSASLCRIMAAGVPVVASNLGSFAEMPDDCVVKIDHDCLSDRILQAFLRTLMGDQALRRRLGENARRYVHREHDITRSAARYISFIRDVVEERPRRRLITGLSAELVQMGAHLTDQSLLESLANEVATLAPKVAFRQNGKPAPTKREPRVNNPKGEETLSIHDSPELEAANALDRRLAKISGIDYKRAAIDYPRKLDPERYHYLFTKPFYNLANKPPKHLGEGMDAETFRHFCDFANMAVALALPAGSRILDVGCGSGWLSEFFARLGYNVTGLDISPELVEIARQRVASLRYDTDHETPLRCQFLVYDIETGPLDSTFDAIVCYDSLHHFEDERAVIRNLAAMTTYGGVVFVLEGDRPQRGSATEEELIQVMQRYETLESPFSREYLRELLDENGFMVIGDYISVNGLFERGEVEFKSPEVNYLLGKKVVREPATAASTVPDSRTADGLAARITAESWPLSTEPGSLIKCWLQVENTGSSLWLTGPAERAGSVMLGIKLFDEQGVVISERHGTPPLPCALASGERIRLELQQRAPIISGYYTLKLDMVSQHVCWFEDMGSTSLVLPLQVVE